MKKTSSPSKFIRLNAVVVICIMSLLPFHAFFTTWLGSNIGHLDLIRVWKDILVACLAPGLLYVAWSDSYIRDWLKRSWLVRLIVVYILLHFGLAWLAYWRGDVNSKALVYALIINLRFLIFFMFVLVIASKTNTLRQYWKAYVLIPAVIVIAFGLMQLILPYDFLKHFGYGPSTIPAFQTVDQKLSYRRIQSTLRGANPLGTYMLLTLPLFLLVPGRLKRLIVHLSGGFVMFFSYSRSAVLGLLATALVMAEMVFKWTKKTISVTTLATLLVVALVFTLRDNNLAQNTFFHTDESSQAGISSNANRLKEMKKGISDIIHEPLGRGPGTAGPASVRNSHPPRLAENYFVQIGQEVGLLGLAIFLGIQICIGQALWQSRKDGLANVLFALIIGLSVVNMVSHAWTDDTLAYIYWGLVAVALAPVIMNKERK